MGAECKHHSHTLGKRHSYINFRFNNLSNNYVHAHVHTDLHSHNYGHYHASYRNANCYRNNHLFPYLNFDTLIAGIYSLSGA